MCLTRSINRLRSNTGSENRGAPKSQARQTTVGTISAANRTTEKAVGVYYNVDNGIRLSYHCTSFPFLKDIDVFPLRGIPAAAAWTSRSTIPRALPSAPDRSAITQTVRSAQILLPKEEMTTATE